MHRRETPTGAHAVVVSKYVLHIRQRTLLARYVNNSLVFILSGLVHWLIGAWNFRHLPCRNSGVAVWYSMQIVGILVEEGFQRLWNRAKGRMPLRESPVVLLAERVVG